MWTPAAVAVAASSRVRMTGEICVMGMAVPLQVVLGGFYFSW
jgi:hypothetical protein